MAKKQLTKTQEMINFVHNNGPCTWTEIQLWLTGCPDAKTLYESTYRGYGAMGIWKCAKRPARNRQYYITNEDIRFPGRYIAVDNKTGKETKEYK